MINLQHVHTVQQLINDLCKPSPTDQLGLVACHQLVEDVVAPLSRQLERHARLLQQI